ncbi:MAG TPA: hypothetical protein V6D28_28425 [Leptolyngbyaceae cyanobacterium]
MATTNSLKTNAGFGQMLSKTYLFGILTATTFGLLPLPAEANPCCRPAGGDNAVIQTSNQQATVTGSKNRIRQNASQSSNSQFRSGGGNQGIVQDQSQSADSSGHGNRVNQNVRQSNSGQNNPNYNRRSGYRPIPRATCNNTCKGF